MAIVALFWGILDHLKMILIDCPENLVKFTTTLCVTCQKNAALEAKFASKNCQIRVVSVGSLKLFAAVDKTEILKKACSYTYLLTYSKEQVLLEKLSGSQLVKKFPAFYGTRRFITAFTSSRHLGQLDHTGYLSLKTHYTLMYQQNCT